MKQKTEEVTDAVLKRITPRRKQRAEIRALALKLRKKVATEAKVQAVKAVVRVEGSVAKDTWLSEEPEIDIFMQVPKTIPRESLGKIGLRIARNAMKGARQVERFAEHPYLEAFVGDVRVNIVPCYKAKLGEWLSATDRTSYHTDYVNKHLKARMRGEVRLLKRFMKGIGVYGAEIKIGGFSGYLCELLILHHKSFVATLRAFANYKQRIVIDVEGDYKRREQELQLLFSEPLVMIDPVDKGRNVASAVQPQKLHTLVAAVRAFLENPDQRFFYPPKTKPLTSRELKKAFDNRGSDIVFTVFVGVKAVPDVLWGQLYRSQRSLRRMVQLADFAVLRDAAWSDEENLNVFILELEQRAIPPTREHLGPPLEREKECESFVAKYLSAAGVVTGPYVEDGRWVVHLRREFSDVVELLKARLSDGGKGAGMAERISGVLRKGFSIHVNYEISTTYTENKGFAEFLTDFLSGRPKWLSAVQAKSQ